MLVFFIPASVWLVQ